MSGGKAVKTMDSMSHGQGKEARKNVINRNISSAINKYWIFSFRQKSGSKQPRRGSSPLPELAAID